MVFEWVCTSLLTTHALTLEAKGILRNLCHNSIKTDEQVTTWDLLISQPQEHMHHSSDFHRVRIGSVVIRCHEYERMFAFWQHALQYEVEHADPDGGFVILRDPDGKGPNISLDQSATRRTGKRGWLHLDLYTTNQHKEVERLVQLGARRYPWKYTIGADFVVLEDPDGNLFCVVQIPEDRYSS